MGITKVRELTTIEDLMGASALRLNPSHYDEVVYYTDWMIKNNQKYLPASERSKEVKLKGVVGVNITSDVSPSRIPPGWKKVTNGTIK